MVTSLRSAARLEEALGIGFQLGVRFGASVEGTSSNLRPKQFSTPPGSPVAGDHRAHVLVGEPDQSL